MPKFYRISFILFSFIIFWAGTYACFSQEFDRNALINSVEKIKKIPSIKTQQDSLTNLSTQIVRLNIDRAIPLFETLDSLVPNERAKLGFYFGWATSVSRLGKAEASKQLRQKALNIAKKHDEPYYQFYYTNSLSSIFISLAKADSATYYNIQADKILKKHPETLAYLKWQIPFRNSAIQEILGNEIEQKKALEKMWEIIDQDPEHADRGFVLYIMLDFYRNQKDYLNQAKFTELFIQHYNKKKLSTPDYHYPIETILLKDDSKESRDNLIKILKLSDSLNNLNSLSQTTNALAKNLIEMGNAREAIPYLENSISKLKAANYPVTNSHQLDLLQQAYRATGDFNNAYKILTEQKIMEDSLRSSKMISTIADYEVKYETEKKDAELQKLNHEAEKAEQQQILYTIALISGGIILSILAIFFYRNKKQNLKLAKQKKMLEITVDEKNVLLKETHHRVKNSFQIVSSLLYLQSENIKDKEAQQAMKEAQNRVRSMVLIHQRLYSKDQMVGVSTDEYFKDLVHDIFESHQAETEKITYTIDAIPIILGIESTTSLGLILNELITNVIKHAFPNNKVKGTMHISFQYVGKTLVLQVKDTGQGMPEQIKETSFGIELITALANKLKAKLIFTPNTPQGTIATLTIHRFIAL